MTDTREGVGEADLLLVPKYQYLTIGDKKQSILDKIRSLIAGFTMVPHAQAWADACKKATGATSFGTYNGHDPTPQRAIDAFSPVPRDRESPTHTSNRVLGDDIADFSLETLRLGNPYGIWYVIWRQHIYNPSIANYWRYMDTRAGGDITQNHFDHVHHSFNETASGVVVPNKPPTNEKEFAMSLVVRYVWGPNPLNQTDWVFDGPSRIFAQIGSATLLRACDLNNIPELSKQKDGTVVPVDNDVHEWFKSVAAGWQK